MKKLIFSFLLASTFTIQQVQTAEESIVGYWLALDSIFEIKNCDGALCGEIVQVFVEEGVDPKSILDSNNMDPELQSRPLIGINIFEGFNGEFDSKNTLKGGRIYNPRDGKTYKSRLRLLDNGNLRVEGCVLFFCGGDEWQPLTVTFDLDGSRTVVLKNTPEEN
jgi:uncharacterized protein (DUF2147 family)